MHTAFTMSETNFMDFNLHGNSKPKKNPPLFAQGWEKLL